MSAIVCALACAANVACYAVWGSWMNAGAAVFCGLAFIYALVMDARS